VLLSDCGGGMRIGITSALTWGTGRMTLTTMCRRRHLTGHWPGDVWTIVMNGIGSRRHVVEFGWD